MCFSAEASFTVAAGLLPSGVYCLQAAARKDRRLLPIAAVPLLFGAQQASEGLVWIGLHHGDAELTRQASLAFLLPALALWPFWIPFMMWYKEEHPLRRRVLLAMTVTSTAWLFVVYLPIALGPRELLTTHIVDHSIAYDYPDLPLFQVVPRAVLNLLYGLTVVAPLLMRSDKKAIVPGLIIAASAIACLLIFHHAFVSVWCFFAAMLAVYLVWVFRTLPEATASDRLSIPWRQSVQQSEVRG